MKQTIFTLLIFSSIGLLSCRKNTVDPDIKQYDQAQIQAYITANGLTGMQRDPNDTTGIYYQILGHGNGAQIDYPDRVSVVYTLKSFDGKFIASDTVLNHFSGFVGHAAPNGFALALRNIVKFKGSSARLLVPSHLAYGRNGTGTGSSTNVSGRIAGNQSLDYYVHLIDNQDVYDDLVIRNYMTANSLTGYTKTASGLYYKIITPGTGTSAITDDSSISTTYTGQLMNNSFFDNSAAKTAITFPSILGLVSGVDEGLKYIRAGGSISLLLPSRLAYGAAAPSTSIPANACLRFEFQVVTVTP